MNRDLKRYIAGLKHGGFRSFLRRGAELGVAIEPIKVAGSTIHRLDHGGNTRFCFQQNVPVSRLMGNLTKNKVVTKTVLEAHGIRTPRGVLAVTFTECLRELKLKKLDFPLITKPLDGSLAQGVTWNITTSEELRVGFDHAKGAYGERKKSKVLIEEMRIGNEYRVLVFNDKVVSCVQKIPAGVTGDGKATIQNLIRRFNKSRVKGFEIKLDRIAKRSLRVARLTLDSVLPAGTFFKFRNNLNMSDGGRSVEVTDRMSPNLKKKCIQAIRVVGLTYGGLDLITKDIASDTGYAILEVNPNPFYNMHEKPLVEGKGVDVSGLLLRYFFPGLR
jgi:cyanophycin synthetase